MNKDFTEIWVYLSTTPLLGLTITLAAYLVGTWLFKNSGNNPLINPVLIAVTAIVALLWATDTPYETYFDGAQFVHFLLGPATVALAIPLYNQFHQVKKTFGALIAALLCGSVTAAVSAIGIAWLFDGSKQTLLSLAPKSVTTPIAMGITEKIGGLPSLTAVLVILTGIIGAVFGRIVLNLVRVKDMRARGLAIGVASHGIGTAAALQTSEVAGAFAGLAMGLNGIATAILIPVLITFLF